MRAAISIDEALTDRNLLGAALGDPVSWSTWLSVLKAAFGQPLDTDETTAFSAVAGGRAPPVERVRELWAVVGRRGGKSCIAAAVAVYLAAIVGPRGRLAAGEVGYVLALAASKAQARVVHAYAEGILAASPVLKSAIEEVTAEEIRLRNGVVIAVHTNSFRTVRGRTLLAAVFDEVAFWRDETTASPDVETYRAVIPALATTGGMLVAISSPYRKAGLLYSKWRQAFGQDDPRVLVIQGSALTMNPALDAEIVESARAEDPEAARAEWDGEFRNDLEPYVSREVIETCTSVGVHERPPIPGDTIYRAFVDPSGGSVDAMAIAIAHREKNVTVLDAVRERRAPFSPESCVEEFAALLRRYGVNRVTGDRYGGSWPPEAFKRHGITYIPAEQPKSMLYQNLLPRLNSSEVDLLDVPRLAAQLTNLERRTSRGGKDSIDHPVGGRDDVANCLAGVVSLVTTQRTVPIAATGSYRSIR